MSGAACRPAYEATLTMAPPLARPANSRAVYR